MKTTRRLILLFSVISMLTAPLCACQGGASDDPFGVFSGDITAELSVEINGNASACTYERVGDCVSIAFTSPSELCGVSFSVSGDTVKIRSGETETVANEKISLLPRLLDEVLSVKKDMITDISSEKIDSGDLTVIRTASTVYRFNSDGAPLGAEGIAEGASFKLTVNAFSSGSGTVLN